MSQPTLQDVHVNRPMTEISIKYKNEEFIGEQLFKPIMVNKESDKYWTYGKQDFKLYKTKRAPGDEARTGGFTIDSDSTYNCDEHAWADIIPDRIRENQDEPINLDIDKTEYCTNVILLDLEDDIRTLAGTSSTYPTGHYESLSAGDQWDNNSSDPIKKVRGMLSTIHSKIFIPTKNYSLFISKDVFDKLVDHPQVIERIKYSQLGVTTEDLLAKLFGVKQVIVAGAGYDSAAEGQTEVLTYLWSKKVIAAYVNPNPGLKMLTFGATFRRKGYRQVRKWREEKKKSDMIEVSDLFDTKVICSQAGYLLDNVIA